MGYAEMNLESLKCYTLQWVALRRTILQILTRNIIR